MIKRSVLNSTNLNVSYRTYLNIQEEYKKKISSPSYKNFDVFLCHASKDIEEILKLKAYIKYFENKDAYLCEVDDPQLDPSKANKKTAEILQNRMEHCKELYFVISKNSQKSTWMPWELGYFNGKKVPPNIYVYPIIENYESDIYDYEGHEYLELYPIKR